MRVYGASDDLIEVEGVGEHGCYADAEKGVYVFLSDGTDLLVRYGKEIGAIWAIEVLAKGSAFERLDVCLDEDAEIYSDVAHFREPIRWAWAAPAEHTRRIE